MRHSSNLIRTLLLSFAIQFVVSGCAEDLTVEQYLTKANEYFKGGKLDAAQVELSNALQKDPGDADARWLMGQVAFLKGEAPRAEKEIRRAIELGLPEHVAKVMLLRAMLQQGAFDRIIEETATPTEDATVGENASISGLRAQALLFKGDLAAASSELDRGRKLEASNVETTVGSAYMLSTTGRLDDARAELTKMLQKQPDIAEGWSLLGDIELSQRRFDAAEAAFDKAIAARKYATLDLAKRAYARIQQDKIKEAAPDLQALGKIRHPYVDYVRGLSDFKEKKLNEAASAFEASLLEAPTFRPPRLYLAITRLLLGQMEQARTHAEMLREQAPDSAGVNILLGAAQIGREDYGLARTTLETALKSDPESAIILQMLTSAALLDGDERAGLRYAERLVALQPQSRDAASTLALARLMSGGTLPESPNSTDNSYQAALLSALQEFRDNRFDDARSRAKSLRDKFPDKTDPIALEAAINLATGHWPEARAALEQVLERQPDDRVTRINLAKLQLHEGKFEQVKTLVAPLVKASQSDEAAALLLVAAEHSLGHEAAADSALEALLRENPSADLARALSARRLINAGKPDQAITLLNQVGDARIQGSSKLLELRGNALLLTGDFKAALEDFERWTKMVPTSAPAYLSLAETKLRLGKQSEARDALQRAIESDARYLPARLGEIRLLIQMRQLQQAKTAVARLKKDFGDLPEVLATSGWHALNTGDFTQAETDLGKALAKAPSSELTVEYARALWGQKKQQQTLDHLNKWLATHPKDTVALLYLAGAQLSLGQDKNALIAYRRVLELHPDHLPSINNIAWLLRDSEPEEALKMAQRGLGIAPNDAYLLDTLGTLHLTRKEFREAEGVLTRARIQSPKNPQIAVHLARAKLASGKPEEAQSLLNEVAGQIKGTALDVEAQRIAAEIRAQK